MSNFVIGIGGTGAKCVEALVHLAAAGLVQQGRVDLIFVDPDSSNGSLERVMNTINEYNKCANISYGRKDDAQGLDLFHTKLRVFGTGAWTPRPAKSSPESSLSDIFFLDMLKKHDPSVAYLSQVLLTPRELTETLEKGFMGHPSIGAAVFGKALALEDAEPWTSLINELQNQDDGQARKNIVLIGSVFGGTGAAGIPTMAKLLREKIDAKPNINSANVKISAILLLPYFSFANVETTGLKADSNKFLPSTKAALKYYHSQDFARRLFYRTYLLGDHDLSRVNVSDPGGRGQSNEPHFLEILAALGCVDIFQNHVNPPGTPIVDLARNNPNRVEWSDFPYPGGTDRFKDKIVQLMRCAFAYLSTYYPALQELKVSGKYFAFPWFVNLQLRHRVGIDTLLPSLDNPAAQEEVHHHWGYLAAYFEYFLKWIAHVQNPNIAAAIQIELIRENAFCSKSIANGQVSLSLLPAKEFLLKEFGNLVLPEAAFSVDELDRLWRGMSEAKPKTGSTGFGKFMGVLYDECEKRGEERG